MSNTQDYIPILKLLQWALKPINLKIPEVLYYHKTINPLSEAINH